MADDTYVKVTESMASNLDKVSKSLEDISKLNVGVRQQFVDITKTTSATGQAWTAISRFTSGTGFWKFQNKIKAVSNVLQFQQKIQEKRLKLEQELTNELANIDGNLQTVMKTREGIERIIAGTAETEETISVMGSKYFKVLKNRVGVEKALLKLKDRTVKAEEKSADYMKQFDKGRLKEVKFHVRKIKNLEDELSIIDKLYKDQSKRDEERKRILEDIDEANQQSFITQQNINNLTDKELMNTAVILDSQKELNLLRENEVALKLKAQSGDEAAQKEKEKLDKQVKILEEKIEKSKKELKDANVELSEDFFTGEVYGVDASKRPKKSDTKEKILKFFKLDKAYKMWQKRHELKVWLYRKKTNMLNFLTKNGTQSLLRGLGKFVAKGLLLMLQVFLVIGLIVITLIALKEMGFFDWFSQFYGLVKEVFSSIWGTLMNVFVIFGEFIGTVFDFVYALFDPEGNAAQAGMALIVKLSELLWEVTKLGFKILAGMAIIWVGLITTFFGAMWDRAKELGIGGIGALIAAIAGGIALLIAAYYTATILASNTVLIGIALIFGALFGAKGKLGFAEGGVTSSPMQLVGEKGPELVSLPRGSRVHSNRNSQGMMGNTNNITVNVQGRIGASDSELRDIASRVGRMISTEINRSTSSRTGI